jgi:hypothetical protein
MAVAGGLGYLMGRTRKLQLAVMLAAAGVTGRLSRDPASLLKQGVRLAGTSPEVRALADTLRDRLIEAGKDVAMTVVSSEVEALSDRLHERAESLRRRSGEGAQAARREPPVGASGPARRRAASARVDRPL